MIGENVCWENWIQHPFHTFNYLYNDLCTYSPTLMQSVTFCWTYFCLKNENSMLIHQSIQMDVHNLENQCVLKCNECSRNLCLINNIVVRGDKIDMTYVFVCVMRRNPFYLYAEIEEYKGQLWQWKSFFFRSLLKAIFPHFELIFHLFFSKRCFFFLFSFLINLHVCTRYSSFDNYTEFKVSHTFNDPHFFPFSFASQSKIMIIGSVLCT